MTQKPEMPPEHEPLSPADTTLAQSVQRSAQEIWLAGMGAFAKAQEEGGKVFESLVRDGMELQRKTHAAAEERIVEASSRLSGMSSQAGQQWGRLESIFEDRVARSLNRLGMPAVRDVQALVERVDALSLEVATLSRRLAERDTAQSPAATVESEVLPGTAPVGGHTAATSPQASAPDAAASPRAQPAADDPSAAARRKPRPR